MKKVTQLPGTTPLATAEQMEADLRKLMELFPVVAEAKIGMFKAYVKAGFTEQQALSLLKKGMEL